MTRGPQPHRYKEAYERLKRTIERFAANEDTGPSATLYLLLIASDTWLYGGGSRGVERWSRGIARRSAQNPRVSRTATGLVHKLR